MTRHAIKVPELELPGVSIVLSAWLINVGDLVVEGDRVAEIVAGAAMFDLESPVTGILVEKLAAEDEQVIVGQVVGMLTAR